MSSSRLHAIYQGLALCEALSGVVRHTPTFFKGITGGIFTEITLHCAYCRDASLYTYTRCLRPQRAQEQGFPGARRAFLASSERPARFSWTNCFRLCSSVTISSVWRPFWVRASLVCLAVASAPLRATRMSSFVGRDPLGPSLSSVMVSTEGFYQSKQV